MTFPILVEVVLTTLAFCFIFVALFLSCLTLLATPSSVLRQRCIQLKCGEKHIILLHKANPILSNRGCPEFNRSQCPTA